MKKIAALAFAIIGIAAIAFFANSFKTTSQEKVENSRIKYGIWSTADGAVLNLLTWVAVDKGFFKKYGLDVELVSMTQPLIGLNSGSTDVLTAGPSASTQAGVQGATNFRFIATVQKNSPYAFISTKPASEVRSVALREQSPINMMVILRMLDKLGIKEEDVNFVVLGDPQNQFLALLDGRVDAFITPTGIFLTLSEKLKDQMKGKNVEILYDFLSEELPIFPIGIFANANYIKENPAILQKTLQALKEANEFLINNPEETYQIFAERTDQPVEDVKLFIDVYIKGVAGVPMTRPDVIAIKNVTDFLAKNEEKARNYDSESMMDYSIIDSVMPQ